MGMLQSRKVSVPHTNADKYQLSLIDPRDKIVLQTELDDLCDKLEWSSAELGGTINLADRQRSSLSHLERPPFSE